MCCSPRPFPAKKHVIVAALTRRLGFPTPLLNFLYVVIDHRRLGMLNELIDALRSWLDDHVGIARIEVVSALALPEEQRQRLIAAFNAMTRRKVLAQFHEDASILGGVLVKYGSRLYDGSLKAQLRSLDRAIAQHA